MKNMKRKNAQHWATSLLLSFGLLLTIPTVGWANNQERPSPESRRQANRQRPDGQYRRPMMRWLENLAESDPDTYEELQALQQKDPQAYMHRVRSKMMQSRRDKILDEHPALKAFLKELPEDERAALEKDLFRLAEDSQKENGPEERRRERRRRRRERDIDLEQFDARTEHFENQLERAEERIEQLRALLERRHALREKITDNE